MNRKNIGLILAAILFMTSKASGQVVAGQGLTIGNPPTPPVGSTVRITGIGTENGPLFTGPQGDLLKRLLVRGDLPPGIAWLADTQTFTGVNTFNGATNVVGQSTFTLGIIAPSIRAATSPFSIRNTSNAADIGLFGNARVDITPATYFKDLIEVTGQVWGLGGGYFEPFLDVQGDLTVIGRATVTAGIWDGGDLTFSKTGTRIKGPMSSAVPADRVSFQTTLQGGGPTYLQTLPLPPVGGGQSGSGFLAFNDGNTINSAYGSLSVDTTAVNLGTARMGGTANVLPLRFLHAGTNKGQIDYSGWHFYSKIGVQGIYSETDPFTVYATDSVTPLMHLFDAGRNVVRNTGQNTYWEYQAHGNIPGEKLWRAGIVGGQYHLDAGSDDATTVWSNLFRSTMANGIPNGLWWGDGVRDVTPNKGYQTNLGRLNQKYLALHVAELVAETLVAQDTIATIGGRILVGPTTQLTADYLGQNTMYLKHNNLASGDMVYMESSPGGVPQVEFLMMGALIGPCPANCPAGVTGYAYNMLSSNVDGSGQNQWYAGDAVFNTGKTGNGFIDIYSWRGVKAATEIGPTMVGNVRVNDTYNGWAPRWAIGNLSGLYGYGGGQTYGSAFGDRSAVWISVDSTYGMRGSLNDAQKFVIHPSGYILIGETGAGQFNTYIDNAQILMRAGAINRVAIGAGGLTMTDPAGTPKVQLLPGNLRFYDSSGTNYPFDVDANSTYQTTVGYRHLGGTYPNITVSASTGQMIFASGTTTRMQLDAGNGVFRINKPDGVLAAALDANTFRFYDGGGYHYMTQMGPGYVQIGYDVATVGCCAYSNVYINGGNAYFRQGDKSRMIIAANQGAMTWYAEDGATPRGQIRSDMAQFGGVDGGARFQITYGYALQAFDEQNKQWFHLRSDQMLFGDWYTGGRGYLQLTPTQIALCSTGCPLILYNNGDIHAGGNVYLTGGGRVISSGNFQLGGTDPTYGNTGLTFEQWGATSFTAGRSVVFKVGPTPTAFFGQDAGGALRIRSMTQGSGTGIRLTLGNQSVDPYQEAGLFLTREPQTTNIIYTNMVLQNIYQSAYGGVHNTYSQFVALDTNPTGGLQEHFVGSTIYWWNRVYASLYHSNNQAGFSGATQGRNWAGVACTFNFSGGIMISTDCY